VSNQRTRDATGGGDESTEPSVEAIVSTAEGRDAPPETLTDVRFVGPATAAVLSEAEVAPADVTERRISFNQLVEYGVNPGVAARIRREHSLSWSFESSGEDLDRRSTQVRGLDDDERAWIAASAGDWEAAAEARAEEGPATDGAAATADGATADGSDDPTAADGSGDPTAAEAAWRERSSPVSVRVVEGVDEATARRLAEGGVRSVRALATLNVESAADALELDVDDLAALRERARQRVD